MAKHKTKVKEPYSGVCAFIGFIGGLLTGAAFGINPVALGIGMGIMGFLCGKFARDEEVETVKFTNKTDAHRIFLNAGNTKSFDEKVSVWHKSQKNADGMTPLGKLVFGGKITSETFIEE